MAKDAGKAGKANALSDDMAMKQRMAYVTIRIPELVDELDRLKTERKTLREKLAAMRAAKKAGA